MAALRTILCLTWLALLLLAVPARATGLYPATPGYLATPVTPNVALMIDNSVSMNCTPGGALLGIVCLPLLEQPGAKIAIARTVIQNLVDAHWNDARWSLWSFNTNNYPLFTTRGGLLLADFSGSQSDFDQAVQGLQALTATPSGDALYQIANYFIGGKSVYPTSLTCLLVLGQCAQPLQIIQYGYQQYVSPIQYVCQKNYAVFISDGQADAQETDDFSANGYPVNSYIKQKYGINLNTGAWFEQVANVAAMYQDYGVAPAGQSLDQDGNSYKPGNPLGYPTLQTYTVAFGNADGAPAENLMKATAYFGAAAAQRAADGAYQPGINARNYSVANSQTDLTLTLNNIFAGIQNQVGSAAAGSFSNPSGAGTMYQTSFSTTNWVGRLTGYPYRNGSFDSTHTIAASVPASGRRLMSYSGGRGVAFGANSLDGIGFDPASAIAKATVAGFVQGSDSAPATRARSSLLGDMMNSTPLSFADQDGAALVAVGANDGMLHVFDGATLTEQLGYVPATVQPALAALADPSYGAAVPHQYYVNGPLAQENAGGRSVLVGTLAQGGRGVFALDLSHASQLADPAGTVLWERNSADYASLGYSFARPVIARVNNGSSGPSWAAIVASGYDSDSTCGSRCSHSSKSALLVIDLLRGSPIATLDVPGGNGLSSPAALDSKYGSGSDAGVVDRVYAGDLSGKLWVFDLSSDDPAQWSVAAQPLFQADQPITSRPALKRVSQGVQVMFGTGRLLYGGDESDTALQSIYGLLDPLAASVSTVAQSSLQRNVVSRESSAGFAGSDGTARTFALRDVAVSSSVANAQGWYLPLQSPGLIDGGGERIVYDPAIVNGKLYFTTQIPKSNSASHCTSGGGGWLMALDPATGLKTAQSPFDFNLDGKGNGADQADFGYGSAVVAGFKIAAGMPTALGIAASKPSITLQPYQTVDGQVINQMSARGSSNPMTLSYGIAGAPASAANLNSGTVCPDGAQFCAIGTGSGPVAARRLSWREIF